MKKHRLTLVVATATAMMLLQGCAAVVVGAGVGAASAAHDRRTLGTQIDDKTLSARISAALSDNPAVDEQANINVHVYNGVALLVGQSPSQDLTHQALTAAKKVKHVRKLHNQIRIGEPIPASTATHDVWLASKVRANLLTDKRIDGLHISVTVEDSEVFLMGLVKPGEAEVAVDIARNINGVARVIKAFENM